MIGSFSVVANDRAKLELELLIRSVREFYDTPIYILCDYEVREFLKGRHSNLHFRVELVDEVLVKNQRLTRHIHQHNLFHDPAIILSKMTCMSWAMAEANDTLFLDADVRLLKEIHQDIDHSMDIMMSPHYYVEDRVTQCKNYGYFNAGYTWSDNLDVPNEWRELFLTKSKFYEQECMYLLHNKYHVGCFDKKHNFGFWRFLKRKEKGRLNLYIHDVDWEEIKSIHYHSDPNAYAHADEGLQQGFDTLRKQIEVQYGKGN
jgi:hypothetical protein